LTIGQGEFLAAAAREKAELEQTMVETDVFLTEHKQRRALVANERDQAMAELAAALLPRLDAGALAEAVRRTGCQALVQDDPLARLERERTRLAARVAAIEADPSFRDRELLRAPRTGTLVRHVEELREFRAPLAQVVEQTAHPRLERLLESGYGTDAYQVAWWRLSYYADWKAADEIAGRFPGKTFAQLRGELDDARRAITVYDQQIAELEGQIAAGAALETEYVGDTQALVDLPETTLAEARARLIQHLGGLELGDLADRLKDSPDLALLWKKANGLGAKLEYLDKIVDEQLLRPREELRRQIAKTSSEITKWSRPKYASARYPDELYQRRFVDRQGRSRRFLDRTQKTYETVYVYDSWGRPSLVEELLWWDVMTSGRWDGGFIPQVSAFHSAHPDYSYVPPVWDDGDRHVAAAVEATTQGTSDFHDVS